MRTLARTRRRPSQSHNSKRNDLRTGAAPPLWLAAVVLVGMIVIAYMPALRGGFIWDDDRYVTENPTLISPNGLLRIWFDLGATVQYYPLVFSTFWVEHAFWHLHPFGYHLVNVILHAANALLLWVILRRLSVPGAWLAAMLFALHPVHVDSVAWVTERKNVLSTLFYLLAMLAYIRFSRLDGQPLPPARPWQTYGVVLICFLAALLSKTATCSLPVVCLLLLWWKRDRLVRRDILPVLPLFALAVGMAFLTSYVEWRLVGAAGLRLPLSPADRVIVAGRSLCFAAGKLAWPTNLMFIYPRWSVGTHAAAEWLYPLGALASLPIMWLLSRRLGKGLLAGTLFYVLTLSPVLGLLDFYFMRYSFVSDHFQYVASIGPLALVATAITLAIRRIAGQTVVADRAFVGLSAVLAVTLAALTWRHSQTYRNIEGLWRDTLARNPECWLAHNNLGSLLYARGDGRGALQHFQTAAKLNPDFREAHFNCAQQFQAEGNYAAAAAEYTEVLRLKPDHRAARMALAMALCESGQPDESINQLKQVLQTEPKSPEALYHLGHVHHMQGRLDEAVRYYQEAIRSDSTHANAHYNLGQIMAARGDLDGAIRQWRDAARLRAPWPEANYNLGLALMKKGRTDEAIRNFSEALRADPRYVRARIALADALARQGDADGARRELGEATKQEPNNVEARKLLERLSPPPLPNP